MCVQWCVSKIAFLCVSSLCVALLNNRSLIGTCDGGPLMGGICKDPLNLAIFRDRVLIQRRTALVNQPPRLLRLFPHRPRAAGLRTAELEKNTVLQELNYQTVMADLI